VTDPIQISFDTETWGKRPGCEIRSIGACVFDPVTGDIPCYDPSAPTGEKIRSLTGAFYIATENPRGYYDARGRAVPHWYNDPRGWETKYDLHRDPDTEAWWAEQSDEAQGAFENPVDLKVGLERFAEWLSLLVDDARDIPNIRLWSHGAATDAPWLAAAYHACGLPVPWHYRAPRDTRTLFDLAGIDDHSAWLRQHPGPLGVPHHALDDAICQARAVCGAYGRIQSPDREFHVGRVAMQRYADWTNQNIDIGGAWAAIERAITEGADHLREIATDMDAGRFEREL